MNLTRRNILKALGISSAVSISGASIAKEPMNGAHSSWEGVQEAVKVMNAAQAVPRVRGKNNFSKEFSNKIRGLSNV